MADDAKAWLVYFPLAPGVARLAWVTEISGDPDAFLVVVDAEDGTVLFRKNLTNYQTQSGDLHHLQRRQPGADVAEHRAARARARRRRSSRDDITLIGNEAPNTFNNLGWITDGANNDRR